MHQEESNPRMRNVILTGFSANDPDDETFSLEKIGTYPGELPYEIEHTVDVKADIYQVNSESHQESNKSQVPSSPDETKEIPKELELRSFSSKEKEEIITESYSKPLNRTGLLEEEHEAMPYEKSGLIPKGVSKPFASEGTSKDEIEAGYQKSGISEIEEEQRDSDGIKTIWDIFENEQSEFTETKTGLKEEKEPIEVEKPFSLGSETKEGSILADEGSVIDFPLEIKTSEYHENEFAKVIDKDFRDKILVDLERSKEKNTPEREFPTQNFISTSEIGDLQKELPQEGEEKINDTKYIEVDLTAINLPQPSKIIGEEIKLELDNTIEPENQPKEKKAKKEKKKKKKSKAEPIADVQAEPTSKEADSTIEQPTQVEEQKIGEQQIQEKSQDEKKKKSALVFWLASAGLLTLLLVVFFILKPLWFTKIFEGKRIEPSKLTKQSVQKLRNVDKTQASLQKNPEESKLSPTLIEKPKSQEQPPMEVTEILPPKEPPNQPSRLKTEIPQKITPSVIEESIKPKPATSKTAFAWKTPQESVPVIEIIPQREYSVEVFSTYDPDEANYLLNLLNQKQISSYIKVQVIKNANLYKVRVGNFKNLNDAREFAKQLGFKNVWIDRIR